MDKEDFPIFPVISVILIMIIFSFALGILRGKSIYNDLKQQCAKQHNVYECVIVAVPKE